MGFLEVDTPKVLPSMTKGEYNANAQSQTSILQHALGLLVEAANSFPLTPGRPVQILELGCSQGVNSMQPVKVILETLAKRACTLHAKNLNGSDSKERRRRLEVVVTHDDLPSNDFLPLLQLIADPQMSYLPRDAQFPLAVYPFVAGRSLYEQLLPPESAHLVFSFSTLHWLSAKPVPSDVLFPFLTQDDRVRQAFEKQERADLVRVLTQRATELVQGGMLLAQLPITDGNPRNEWALPVLNSLATDWAAAGKLTRDEVAAMASMNYLRREESVRSGLEAVGHLWQMKRFIVLPVPGPSYTLLREGASTRAQYAQAVRQQRAAVFQGYMTMQLALTRGAEDAQRIMAQLFDEFELRLAATPDEEGILAAYFLLERTDTVTGHV